MTETKNDIYVCYNKHIINGVRRGNISVEIEQSETTLCEDYIRICDVCGAKMYKKVQIVSETSTTAPAYVKSNDPRVVQRQLLQRRNDNQKKFIEEGRHNERIEMRKFFNTTNNTK